MVFEDLHEVALWLWDAAFTEVKEAGAVHVMHNRVSGTVHNEHEDVYYFDNVKIKIQFVVSYGGSRVYIDKIFATYKDQDWVEVNNMDPVMHKDILSIVNRKVNQIGEVILQEL